MRSLYQVLFNRVPKVGYLCHPAFTHRFQKTELKKNVEKFNGFGITQEDYDKLASAVVCDVARTEAVR